MFPLCSPFTPAPVSWGETNKAKRNCHRDSSDVTGGDKPYSSMCIMRFSLYALHINTQSVHLEGLSFGVLEVEELE